MPIKYFIETYCSYGNYFPNNSNVQIYGRIYLTKNGKKE